MKIKNFFKYNFISIIYLLLFVLSQTIMGFVVLGYKIMNDLDFGDKFFNTLMPYYDNPNNMVQLNQYSDFYNDYMQLLNELLVPIVLVSNLIIILIVGFKLFITRKKETFIGKVNIQDTFKYLGIGVFLNIFISFILTFLPTSLINDYSSNIEGLLFGSSPIILFLATGIFAPIAEELIFRYGMLKNLLKINPIFAIISQALLFGVLHGNIVQSSYAFILGLIFGYIVYKKKNVTYSILMHIGVNASSVISVFFEINEFISLLSIMIILFLIFFILKKFNIGKID